MSAYLAAGDCLGLSFPQRVQTLTPSRNIFSFPNPCLSEAEMQSLEKRCKSGQTSISDPKASAGAGANGKICALSRNGARSGTRGMVVIIGNSDYRQPSLSPRSGTVCSVMVLLLPFASKLNECRNSVDFPLSVQLPCQER